MEAARRLNVLSKSIDELGFLKGDSAAGREALGEVAQEGLSSVTKASIKRIGKLSKEGAEQAGHSLVLGIQFGTTLPEAVKHLHKERKQIMGIMDKIFGREDEPGRDGSTARRNTTNTQRSGTLTDEQALARYRYMLQTAPPETIEEAHAEAFAKLTPEQRRMALEQLSAALPEKERTGGAASKDDPQTLARMATRAELRQPGTLERTFGGVGGGMGFGGMMAGSFLSSIAGVVVGSYIAEQFFGNDGGFDGGADQGGTNGEAGNSDVNQDAGGDDMTADADAGMGDFGGDLGDFGGDI